MQKNTYLSKRHFELYDSFIPIFRLIFALCLICICIYKHEFEQQNKKLFILLLVYFSYALIFVVFRKFRKQVAFHYPFIMALFEILIITLGVVWFGRANSPFFYIYLFIISFFAAVYGLKRSLLAGLISCASYFGALVLTGEKATSDLIIKILVLLGFSLFTGFINERLNQYNIKQATTDQLTLLHNRQSFYEEFENILLESEKTGCSLSLLVFDVDHFKIINDQTGHLEGDRILAGIGEIIRQNIMENDIAARYGGDEFVIVLPNTSRDGADALCAKLNSRIQKHFSDQISVSAGMALYPSDGKTFQELFHVADMAMYQQKALKRDAGISPSQKINNGNAGK